MAGLMTWLKSITNYGLVLKSLSFFMLKPLTQWENGNRFNEIKVTNKRKWFMKKNQTAYQVLTGTFSISCNPGLSLKLIRGTQLNEKF